MNRAEERTTGVVLRTRLLTETSLIVHWLTGDFGRIATVAKGARRPKSPFRGKLDLFHLADFTFRRSARSDLHALVEVGMREGFPEFRSDWRRLVRASYAVALVEATTEMDTPVPEVFRLFLEYLGHLAGGGAGGVVSVLALEVKHLAGMGLEPDWSRGAIAGGVRRLAERLRGVSWGELGGVEAEVEALTGLSRFLHGFWAHHLGGVPRGRAEALELG